MEIIDNIPAGRYQGYIWYSDQQKPQVLNDVPFDGLELTAGNPFIIEGQLLDTEERLSYSIHFVDGAYLAYRYNLDDLPKDSPVLTYVASFADAPGALKFISVWREEADPLCEGMQVLTPAENVFAGFENR